MDEHAGDDFLDYEYPGDAVDDPNDPLNFDDDLYDEDGNQHGDWCPRCGGTGDIWDGQEVCPVCLGEGYVWW